MTAPVASPPPEATPSSRRHRAVGALRRILESSDPGTLAALRRADPVSPPLAFYRVTVDALHDVLPEDGDRRTAQEGRWAVVVSAMATAVSGPTPCSRAYHSARLSPVRAWPRCAS